MARAQGDTIELRTRHFDLSKGVVGGVSDAQNRGIRHARFATNVAFRPIRAGGVRKGSRDALDLTLPDAGHSIGKFYDASGGNKVFAASYSASAATGSLWRLVSPIVKQTIPWTAFGSGALSFVNLNGVIVAVQSGGTQVPMFFSKTNAADTWLSCLLPTPPAGMVLAASTGGSMTPLKTYFYRLRWRFANGSSKSTAPISVALAAGQGTVTASSIPTSTRTDYLGWTLERTKSNGDVNGPFYLIADGTAASYVDSAADAGLGGLFDRTSEVTHGEPVHMDGLVAHQNRLFGWEGSTVHMSNLIGDDEATGIFNWVADALFQIAKDDGDTVQTCIGQGDRLVIFKRRSVHVLEGLDPDSYRIRLIYDGAGASGLRAAASAGGEIFFCSIDGGFFRLKGDRVEPFGWVEVGHYKDTFDLTRISAAVVKNYIGDLVLFAYAAKPNTYNSDLLVYDLRFGTWTHYDWRVTDAVVQRDATDFGGSTMLWVDPVSAVPGSSAVLGSNPSFAAWASDGGIPAIQSFASDGTARWAANGISLTSVGVAGSQSAVCATDGGTGVFVAWLEKRNGTRVDLYMQRLNSAGAIQWAAGGVAICDNAVGNRLPVRPGGAPVMVSDGAGGVIVGWRDTRTVAQGQAFFQRVDSTGAKVWSASPQGVLAHALGNPDEEISMVSDGLNGVLVALENNSATARVQRLRASDGAGQFGGGNGIAVVTSASITDVRSCADGASGIVILVDVLGQVGKAFRYSNAGAAIFSNVSVLPNAADYAASITMCGDGLGGAFIFFRKLVSGASSIGSQRIDSAGAPVLAAFQALDSGMTGPGVPNGDCVSTSDRGAILCYQYKRASDSGVRVRATKVDASLNQLWNTLMATTPADNGVDPTCCTDGADGAIVFWQDERGSSINDDIYGRRVNSVGTALWAADGVAGSIAAGLQGPVRSAFTGAPANDIPTAGLSGFHVWSAFQGTTDYASAGGANGKAIPFFIESPPLDDGFPDDVKELTRIEVHLESTVAAPVAVISVDGDEQAVTVPLSIGATTGLATWDDGISKWDDLVSKWLGDPKVIAQAGIPAGVSGKRYTVALRNDLKDDAVLIGYVVDAVVLPERRWS